MSDIIMCLKNIFIKCDLVILVSNYNLKPNIAVRLREIINTMSNTKYLVIFYGVSAGQNGENLGSDEQDLVMLIFLVINTEENKVRLQHKQPK